MTRACKQCGTTFKCFPRTIKRGGGKFCSQKCAGEFKSKKISCVCPICGKTFLAKKSRLEKTKSKILYCSTKCMGFAQRDSKPMKSNGYIMIYAPWHPNSNMHGYVYEHTLIASKVLGRPLGHHEMVLHINNKRDDNKNSNLMICTKSYSYYIRFINKKLSSARKKALSLALKGRVLSEEHKAKIASAKRGKRRPDITGSKHPNWQGGISDKYRAARQNVEAYHWRRKVFARDNYTCVLCKDNKGGNLNAHHIKPFNKFKELRYKKSNGITLCEDCHRFYHSKKIMETVFAS